MPFTIRRDESPSLIDHGTVLISFTTTSVLRIEWQRSGLEGIRITEVPIDADTGRQYP